MKKIIKKIFRILGYNISSLRDDDNLSNPLNPKNFFDLYFSNLPKDFFFVQIGANDGKNRDPLNSYIIKYDLFGLAIEPQSDVFKLLQQNYKNTNVKCVNVAIGEKTDRLPFYSLKEPVKTEKNLVKMTSLSSFDRGVLTRTLSKNLGIKNIENFIQETYIKVLSFEDLAKTYNLNKIDFLQIDCEGWDWKILKTIDLVKHNPSIINFESYHLPQEEYKECKIFLKKHGYKWFQHGLDTCAYKA